MAFKTLLVQLDDTKACDRRVVAAMARHRSPPVKSRRISGLEA
jgi:hypothetical protein